MICLALLAAAILAPDDGFRMTGEQFWHTPFGTDQRFPLVGDADGDGHADLLSLWPSGDGVIDMARTSPLGKPLGGNVAMRGFGHDGLAAACGPFVRQKAADLLGVFANGEVRVAWGMGPGTNTYQHNDLAAQIPSKAIPKGRCRTAVADFENHGKQDVLVLDDHGNLILLENTKGVESKPSFVVKPLGAKLENANQFSAGPVGDDPRAQCVWLDSKGALYRAFIEGNQLSKPILIGHYWPQEHMVVGHFRGQKQADILIGQQLLPGGDLKAGRQMNGIPPLLKAVHDGPWIAADIDGNGMDDLVRFRRGPERFWGADTFVHFCYKEGEAPGYYCTSNDGLLDVWKTGRIKLPNLDMKALGCKVGHRDVIVELERFINTDLQDLHNNMDRAALYYRKLPIDNPDGTTGIFMHFIYRIPFQMSEHDKIMGQFDNLFPPNEQVGIVHSMFDEKDGPLVAMVNGRNGHFNGGWAVFLHEFGHQMNLSHQGWWGPDYCAIYPSLMSYTYAYSVGDNGDAIGYSDGSLAEFVVNEFHLPKYMPFSPEKVKFLSGSPYHFHLQPAHDGLGTMVDWNFNGLFEDEACCCSINWSHGMTIGPRFDVAKAQTAPAIVNTGSRLLMLYGQDGKLRGKTWLGKSKDSEGGNWSEEVAAPEQEMIGDPTAANLGGDTTWVCYATVEGAVIRRITTDPNGKPIIGPAQLLSDTRGDQPTLAAFNGRLAPLLWTGPHVTVRLRTLEPDGTMLRKVSQQPLDIQSSVPVGAVAGLKTADSASLWVGRIQIHGEPLEGKSEVVRLELTKEGTLEVAGRNIVEGDYSLHRMTLLWQMEKGNLPQGRLYHFSGDREATPNAPQYMTINIPYPDNHGWLVRRYLQPDFQSVSAPGACFYDGNIVYAVRRFDANKDANDTVGVFFDGNGATPGLMGDFNDIGLIRDYGLSRSLREVTR